MYKGIRLGAAAGEHWFVSCFCAFLHTFFSLAVYVSVGVCAWWFFLFCIPAWLHFISLFLCVSHLHLQLLTRYVKTSTFSLCHGREPQLEKLSTTSVQLTPLVSHMTCFSQYLLAVNIFEVTASVSELMILFGLDFLVLHVSWHYKIQQWLKI